MYLSLCCTRLVALVVSVALLAAPPNGISFAQVARPVGPAVPGANPGPLPVGLNAPRVFHHTVVAPEGTLKLHWVDVSIPAPGLPVVLERTYRSDLGENFGLGPGWSWSFGSRMTFDARTAAPAIREANGEYTHYVSNSPHRYLVAASGRRDSILTAQSSGGYRRIFADGASELYDRLGRLTRREDRARNGHTVHWEQDRPARITDAAGRDYSLRWRDGYLVEFEDPLARITRFDYANGRLASVTDALGRTTRYSYDRNRLGRIELVEGARIEARYDATGRVSALVGPGELSTRFSYEAPPSGGAVTQSTEDAEGNRTTLEFRRLDDAEGEPQGFVARITDGTGATVSVESRRDRVVVGRDDEEPRQIRFNELGLPEAAETGEEADPSGPDVTTEGLDRFGHPTALVVSGEKAVPEFDVVGRLLRLAWADGTRQEFKWDAGDRLLEAMDRDGRTLRYEYDGADRLTALVDPRGNRREFAWDTRGLLVEDRDAVGPAVRYLYDRAGRLVTVIRGIQRVTISYDAADRVVSTEDDLGNVQQIEYDAGGRVAALVTPRGRRVTFTPPVGDLQRAVTIAGATATPVTVKPLAGGGYNVGIEGGGSAEIHPERDGGLQFEAVSALGRRTSAHLAADGIIDRLVRPGRAPMAWERDADGRLVALRVGDQIVRRLEANAPEVARVRVDSRGRVISADRADGTVETYVYNPLGDLTRIESDGRSLLVLQYDKHGRLVAQRDDGGETQWSYDDSGRLIAVRARDGSETSYRWDGRDRVIESRWRAGAIDRVTRYAYNRFGDLIETVDPDGVTQRIAYDVDGRVTVRHIGSQSQTYEYDSAGRVSAIRDSVGVERFTWDADGRLVEHEGRDRIQLGYGLSDDPDSVTDAAGRVWRIGRDAQGRAVTVQDPLGGTTRAELNPLDAPTAVTDPDGRQFALSFNPANRLVAERFANGPTVRAGYDARGRLAWREDSAGRRLDYGYDIAGRVTTVSSGDRILIRYNYDPSGRLSHIEDDLGTHQFEWAPGDLATRYTDAFGRAVAWSYDSAGRLSQTLGPDGRSTWYSYNATGQLVRVDAFDGTAISLRYDVAGRLVGAGFGALSIEHQLDSRGRDAGFVLSKDGATRFQRRVTYDTVGNPASIVLGSQETKFEHDALGRLTRSSGASETQQWRYDGAGNRSGDSVEAAEYDASGRLTRLGGRAVAYDDAGHITSIEGAITLEYDVFGRVAAARRPDAPERRYRYDFAGRLVERSGPDGTLRVTWDGSQPIAAYDGGGQLMSRIDVGASGASLLRIGDRDGTATTVLSDALGTPVAAIDGDESVRALPRGAWGTPATSIADGIVGFTGAVEDPDTGLVFLGARAYLPAAGRFVSPDPIGWAGGINPYAYANNAPLRLIDHTGLAPTEPSQRTTFTGMRLAQLNTDPGLPPPARPQPGKPAVPAAPPPSAAPQPTPPSDGIPRPTTPLGGSGKPIPESDGLPLPPRPQPGKQVAPVTPPTTAPPQPSQPAPPSDGIPRPTTPLGGSGKPIPESDGLPLPKRPQPSTPTPPTTAQPSPATPSGPSPAPTTPVGADGRPVAQPYDLPLPPRWRAPPPVQPPSAQPTPPSAQPTPTPAQPRPRGFRDFFAPDQASADPRLTSSGRPLWIANLGNGSNTWVVPPGATLGPNGTWVMPHGPSLGSGSNTWVFPPGSPAPGPNGTWVMPQGPSPVGPNGTWILPRPTPPTPPPPIGGFWQGPPVYHPGRTPVGWEPQGGWLPPRPSGPEGAAAGNPGWWQPGQPRGEPPVVRGPATQNPGWWQPGQPRGEPPVVRGPGIVVRGPGGTQIFPPGTPPMQPPPSGWVESPRPGGWQRDFTGPPPSEGTGTQAYGPRDFARPGRSRGGPPRVPPPPRPPSLGQGGEWRALPPSTRPSSAPRASGWSRAAGVLQRYFGPVGRAFQGAARALAAAGPALALAGIASNVFGYLTGQISYGQAVGGILLSTLGAALPFLAGLGPAGALLAGLLGAALALYTIYSLARNFWEKWNQTDPTFLSVGSGSLPVPRYRGPLQLGAGGATASLWNDEARRVTAVVLDSNGATIRTLGTFDLSIGVATLTWDGSNDAGGRAPPGRYELTVSDDAGLSEKREIEVSGTRPSLLTEAPSISGDRLQLPLSVSRHTQVTWWIQDSEGKERAGLIDTSGRDTLRIPLGGLSGGTAKVDLEARDNADAVATTSVEVQLPTAAPTEVAEVVRLKMAPLLDSQPAAVPASDAPLPWLGGETPASAQTIGAWRWNPADQDPFGKATHRSEGDGPDVHYVIAPSAGWFLADGMSLVQYLRVDPKAPPRSMVIQLYTDDADGEHRVLLGETEPGQPAAWGTVPSAGAWMRLRISAADFNAVGRRVTGVLFGTRGGRVDWGTTTTSYTDDPAPRVVEASRTFPVAEAMVSIEAQLRLKAGGGTFAARLVTPDGRELPLLEQAARAGPIILRWRGAAGLAQGASLRLTRRNGSETVTQIVALETPSPLIARIDFPRSDAVGRQTVPVFGQAGGAGFRRWVLDWRPAGAAPDAPWQVIAEGSRQATISEEEIRNRLGPPGTGGGRTIFGNIGSFNTGSLSHSFPFHPTNQTISAGRATLRLRTFGENNTVVEDRSSILVGEVVVPDVTTVLTSPDGHLRLEIPPLALADGMVAVGLERANDVKEIAWRLRPGGLGFRTPIRAVTLSDEARRLAIAIRNAHGNWTQIARAGEPVLFDRVPPGGLIGLRLPTATPESRSPVATQSQRLPQPWPEGISQPNVQQFLPRQDGVWFDGDAPREQLKELAFAYRLLAGSRAALVVRHDAGTTTITLAGLASTGGGQLRSVGGPPLTDDGTWRAAIVPLAELLGERVARVRRIELIAPAEGGGAMPADALEVTGLRLGPAWPAAPGRMAVPLGAGDMLEWALTDSREAPAKTSTNSGPAATLDLNLDGADGVRWLHLRVRAADGTESPWQAWPVPVRRSPPVVAEASPAPGTKTDAQQVSVRFNTDTGVAGSTARLIVGGVRVPVAALQVSRDGRRIDVAFGRLSQMPVAAADGTVEAVLEAISDHAGNALSAPFRWSWQLAPERVGAGTPRQLTLDGGYAAAWSPDGNRIAFLRAVAGEPEVFEVPVGGGQARQVTRSGGGKRALAYGADGALLVADRLGLARIDAAGREVRLLGGVADPAVGFGRTVVADLHRVRALSGNDVVGAPLVTLEEGAIVERPQPAPDGGVLFTQYFYNRTIWRLPPNGETPVALSDRLDDPAIEERDAGPSPDGRNIVFVTGANAPAIWLAPAAGGERTRLATTMDGTPRRPAFSPDGRYLLFDSDAGGVRNLWVVELLAAPTLAVEPKVWAIALGRPAIVTASAEAGTTLRVAVLARRGQVVRELRAGTVNGPLRVEWDGRDANGELVPDGNYTVVAESTRADRTVATTRQITIGNRPPVSVAYRSVDGRAITPLTLPAVEDGVLLRASDVAGIGIDRVEWRNAGDAQWRRYEVALTFKELPGGTLEFRAIDRYGQVEPARLLNLRTGITTLSQAPMSDTARGWSFGWLAFLASVVLIAGAGLFVVLTRRRRAL
ncbi:MAG: hypothetical protein K2Y71_15830 [Xanthobacteraceae bacterium]|nr:hypothetical protein [Xanthobacteraceae bacterium]